MPRCVKIMPNCACVMRPRCLRFSTTLSLDCLLDKGPPMLLRPDAHSPIISTEHSLLSWLKEEIRLCNSPVLNPPRVRKHQLCEVVRSLRSIVLLVTNDPFEECH